MSRYWPSPVRSRCSRAATIAPIVRPGRDVPQAQHRDGWRPVRIADHICHCGVGLRDIVVAGLGGERSGLSEGRDRTHDDARIQGPHGFVIEAHSLDHARRVILNYYINFANQPRDDRMALGLFHIDTEAFFAAVLLDVIGAAAVAKVWEATREVAGGRKLDLDNLRTHLSHQPCDRRPGQHLGEVEYFVAVEYVTQSIGRHLRYSSAKFTSR